MHFVIMGCGRVGATLALHLEGGGHDVAVIDQTATAFRRLGAAFEGRRVKGVGFDRDTLIEAGIEHTDAFAAVSNGDNSNILAARVARETFGVEHVVARIYDPRRAAVYARLGIPTVATVQWTVDRVIRRLMPSGTVTELTSPTGDVGISEVYVDPSWVATPLTQIEALTGARAVYLSRTGRGVVPTAETVFQEGDHLRLAHRTTDIEAIQALLAAPKA